MRCIDVTPSRGPILRRSPGLRTLCHSATLLDPSAAVRPHCAFTPPILTRCGTLSRRWIGLPADIAARSSLTIYTVCAVCASWRRPATVIPCATVRVSTEFHRRTLTAPMARSTGLRCKLRPLFRSLAVPRTLSVPYYLGAYPVRRYAALTAQPVPSAMCHVVAPRRRT
jgi:hypothetical protein